MVNTHLIQANTHLQYTPNTQNRKDTSTVISHYLATAAVCRLWVQQ